MTAAPWYPDSNGTGAGYIAPGAVLAGRYEIGHEIGRGGYSVVYRARDRALDAEVAVKLLVPPPASAALARERMRREALAVRGLAHANIVGVHDYLEDGPWSFVIMELVAGPDLARRVASRGPLTGEETVVVGQGIATALSAAHRRGILHRDVKPQNILLDPTGIARLTDFGSAHLDGQASVTQTGGLVGTLLFAAPEVLAGERGDARSDIYALGMTLYYALTGDLPPRPSLHLPPPSLPDGHRPSAGRSGIAGWLDEVVACATSALPGDRFPSAASLLDALSRHDPLERPHAAIGLSGAQPCPLCGAEDRLGMGLCLECAAVSGERADSVIFVQRGVSPGETSLVLERLRTLAGSEAAAGELSLVASGRRALARVPGRHAARVIDRLSALDIPARAGRRWTPLPLPFFATLGMMAVTGGAAGILAAPPLLWSTPVLVAALWLEGRRQARRPLLRPGRPKVLLPPALHRELARAMDQLPPGPGRSLLADIIRTAAVAFQRMGPEADPGGIRESLDGLLRLSADVARHLSELDQTLARLTRQRNQQVLPVPRLSTAISQCERARDTLVQRLLDVITLLSQLRHQAADSPMAAGRTLASMTAELDAAVRRRADASREIELLLSGRSS
ncbi:MAG: serine/threonine-protein kinase [Gemmatimonadales bacterium]